MTVTSYTPAWGLTSVLDENSQIALYYKKLVTSIIVFKDTDGYIFYSYATHEEMFSNEPLLEQGYTLLGIHAPQKTTYLILNSEYEPIALEIEGEPEVDWVKYVNDNPTITLAHYAPSVRISGKYKNE